MSLRTNIPDPDEMNEQRALWAKAVLREFAFQVSGPQALEDMRELDNVAASFLCDLAHLADERGWKLVDLLRVARARYDLETESRGEQFTSDPHPDGQAAGCDGHQRDEGGAKVGCRKSRCSSRLVFNGFEQLVPPRYESSKKPVRGAGIGAAEDERQAS